MTEKEEWPNLLCHLSNEVVVDTLNACSCLRCRILLEAPSLIKKKYG
jgi:hypothetical protein